MERAIILKGRLCGSRRIDLDEDVPAAEGRVEVIVRFVAIEGGGEGGSLHAFLARLPEGVRSKADIDAQVNHERASWGE